MKEIEIPFPGGSELLPQSIREKLPPLYANEALGLEALALVKFFTPDANWTWYASEFDGNDIFFGLASGLEVELGLHVDLWKIFDGYAFPDAFVGMIFAN